PVTRGFPTESARNGQTPKIQTRLSATTRHSALSGRVIQTFPNAVKHFRFEQRGKRRLHRNPERAHVQACSGWLHAERAQLRPAQIVCLGATAAQAVLGSGFRLMRERGQWKRLDDGTPVLTTVHPSWVLRQPTTAAREEGYRGFVEDLRQLLDVPMSAGSSAAP
ncbi:uracil-DNA glycosylase family protein, partial [Xanthomonas hortorum]